MKLIAIGVLLALTNCAMPKPSIDAAQHSQSLRLIDQGILALRRGEIEFAYANFDLSEQINPSAESIDGLGAVAFMRQQWLKAENMFLQAYQRDPNYGTALAHLALLYEIHGLSIAGPLYRRALAETPDDFSVRNNYAAFLEGRQASPAEVKTNLLKARALFPHGLIEQNLRSIEAYDKK